MMIDAALSFLLPPAPPQTMVGAAGVNIQIGQVIDLLGSGVGTAPSNIIGNVAVFGTDPNTGVWKLDFQLDIGTAATTGTSATANFAIQVAPDSGASGGYLPGTWETAEETGPKAAAALVANAVIRLPMPPAPLSTPRPRYMRVLMVVPAATNFTAGTVTAAFFVQGRDDLQNKQAANNYVVQ
jgi:hypothetical protein